MKAGVVAACVALPLKSVLARDASSLSNTLSPLFSPLQTGQEQLGYYTRSSFAPYVNTQFSVYVGPSNTRGLKLKEMTNYVAAFPPSVSTSDASQMECFSLLFTIPPGKAFEQDTYLIEHAALGNFYLFMVPVSDQRKKAVDYYEAIIFRAPVETLAPNGVPVAPAPRPERAASAPNARISKTEQDIYYFRPNAIKKPKAKKVEPGAEGRKAASRLSMSQAPDVAGLKLGMTIEQVLSLFPGSETDKEIRASLSRPVNKFGVKTLVIHPAKFSADKKFDGVNQIVLTFLDGRISTLNVSYSGPVWANVNEFVSKFAQEKGLPGSDSWDAKSGVDNQLKTLKCSDFEISVFAGGENVNFNYVKMLDLTAQQKLKGRQGRA
jgi:hypothetical protein